MNAFRRINAWLGRKSRSIERRKLFRKVIKVTKLREDRPARRSEYTTELRRIVDRLDAITLAEDMAGVEARIEPVPRWPGLPTEGHRAPVARDEVNSRARAYVIEGVAGVALTAVILLHLMGQA